MFKGLVSFAVMCVSVTASPECENDFKIWCERAENWAKEESDMDCSKNTINEWCLTPPAPFFSSNVKL